MEDSVSPPRSSADARSPHSSSKDVRSPPPHGKTREIADRLVAPSTINRDAKVGAYAMSEDPRSLDVDAANTPSIVLPMLKTFLNEISYDADMAKSYRKFAVFLFYTIVLLVVISMQRHVGDVSIREQYLALEDAYFGFGDGITRNTAEESSDRMDDFTQVIDHLRDVVLATIFKGNDCGNGACDRPDEHPTWDPGDEARNFGGCGADCGVVDTTNVTVRFYDPWKLKQAVDLMTALSQESSVDGLTPAEWGVVDGDGVLISPPAAGWNICHKTDKEQGFIATVCVFDANITVDTMPFRSEELNASSSLFGNSKTVKLYEGEWELRIGYQNFAWTHPETGKDVHFAFPAVRGEICVEDALSGDESCTTWDPCPKANECECEYVENEYVCYDDNYWSTFNLTTMLHDPPPFSTYLQEQPEFAAYPYDFSIKAIGEWWRIQRPPDQTSWTERDPPPALLSGDRAAEWSRECHQYALFLLHPDVSEGRWDSSDVLEIWASSSSMLELDSTQNERHDAKESKAYSFTFDDDDVGCASKPVLLCDDRHYIFGVAPRADGIYQTRGEAMAYALANVNGDIIFRGNAAWTYAPKNTTVGFECPGGVYQHQTICFDQNRSYCVWNVNQDTSAYCDPTDDYTDHERRIYAFGADELDFSSNVHRDISGKYCEPAADCDTYKGRYSGLTDAVACDEDTVDTWTTPTDVSPSPTESSSELRADSIDPSSLSLAHEARHVACAFSESLCGWRSQGNGWRWNHGTTPTDWTGPGADGDPDFYQAYAYVESTGSALGISDFFLEHTNFTLSQAAVLTFDYHMYGHRMGSLTVQSLAYTNSTTIYGQDVEAIWNDEWRLEFNQMPRWHRDVAIVLEPGVVGLRFAVHAIHHTSDVAIDNVAIRALTRLDGATEVPTSTAKIGDEICGKFSMFNDDGVGWGGASYRIVGPYNFEASGTISDGDSWQVDKICFSPRSGCYSLEVTEGSSGARRHWELVVLTEGQGEYAPLAGGVPDARAFRVADDILETECTLAPTFSPHPTVSPAPTCAAQLFVELSDTYGDGYNGAAYTLSDDAEQQIATGTLEDGPYVLETVCLPEVSKCYLFSVSEDNNPSEVSWQVSLQLDGGNVLNGSAPFRGAIFVDADGITGGSGLTCVEASASATAFRNAGTPSSFNGNDNGSNIAQTAVDSPTLPVERLSCYTSWRVAQSAGSENFWTQEPGGVVTCPTPDDSCVMVEYEWPPTEMEEYFAIAVEKGLYPSRPNETLSFIGLGGCKSEFSVQSAHPWSDCVGQSWWNFAPPSSCIECDTNLCNSRPIESQPKWYSNSFGVSATSLFHSMDWVIETESENEIDTSLYPTFLSPDRYATCPTFYALDDTCDITYNTLGCNYDNFACCNDARTGCSAPWYQRQVDDDESEDDDGNQVLQSKWIYAFTTENKVHATVPHSLHSAVKEKMLLHIVGDPNDSDQSAWSLADKGIGNNIPSLSCPECSNVPDSGWRSVDFSVSVPWFAASTGNPNNNTMFPTMQEGDMRIRYFSSPNIVLYGPLLTQKRGELKRCPTGTLDNDKFGVVGDRTAFIEGLRNNLDRLHLGCLSSAGRLLKRSEDDDALIDEDTHQYGIDPTFQSESELYRPANDVTELYDVEEIRPDSQIPYLFQLRMQRFGVPSETHKTEHVKFEWKTRRQEYPHSYPIFFDVNTNVSRAYEILDTLVDGGYFDEATDMAIVKLFLFNPQTETFSLITSSYTAGKSGAVLTDHEIVVVDVSYYSTAVDLCRFVLECTAFILLVFLVIGEFCEMFETVRQMGTLVPYILDLSNLIDFAGYSFQIALVPLWARMVILCDHFTPAPTYDIHDELAEGRIVMAQSETHQAQKVIDELTAINEAVREYELFATVSIIMLAMQCLKSLRFHPTFGLVSQTIVKMASKVFFWFVLLCLVLGCYAVLGSLLFGHDNGDYSDVSTAAITLLAALSGMYDYSTLSLTDTTAQIYFWTYMFIAFFVLLNVLLAIIVEAFDSSVMSLQRRDPLKFFVRASFGCTQARKCLLPAAAITKILNKAVRLIDDHLDEVEFAPRPLSFLQRKFSNERVTHDNLVALLPTLPNLQRAIDCLPECKEGADVRALMYVWKPAIDEDLIALDFALIHLALRSLTPEAEDDSRLLVDVWAVVAINIIVRFGNTSELHQESGEDEASLTAVTRLLEIHRLVDVEGAAHTPNVDVMRTVACCYNYQQNRPDSLIELARDLFDEEQCN